MASTRLFHSFACERCGIEERFDARVPLDKQPVENFEERVAAVCCKLCGGIAARVTRREVIYDENFPLPRYFRASLGT